MTRPENALLELRPGSVWRIDWDDTQNPPAYTLHWDESNADSAPTAAEIEDKVAEIDARGAAPMWGAFMDAIAPTLYATIHAHQSAIIQRLIRLEAGTAWGGANDAIFTYWNTPTGPELTLGQFDTLVAAFTAHNIPATATRDGGTGVTTIAHDI